MSDTATQSRAVARGRATAALQVEDRTHGSSQADEPGGNLVLLDEDGLRNAVEISLGHALERGMVVMNSMRVLRNRRFVGKNRTGFTSDGMKIIQPRGGSPAASPSVAVDLKAMSEYMVQKISETASKDLGDPARRTTMDVIDLIHKSSTANQEALAEKDIKALTDAYSTINRHKGATINVARALLEDEYAKRRAQFITQIETFSGPELAGIAGHTAGNPSATASRWKASGKVFSVGSPEGERFPVFQFADGKPVAVVADVLALMRSTRSDWQIAFWFTSPNAYLGGAKPSDRLSDRDEILMAARREIDTLIG